MFDYDNEAKINQLKTMLNRIFGRAMLATTQLYVDTDSLLDIDCGFCQNANTCADLTHDNDMASISCGETDKGFRMLFNSGGNRDTTLTIEQLTVTGLNCNQLRWKLVGYLRPNYCPFCGRPLFENMKQRRNKND